MYTHSNINQNFKDNNHEEADNLMVHLAVLAAQRSQANAQIMFFSPDTDVLILIIANYELLPKATSISMTSATLQIQPFWEALGAKRTKALYCRHSMPSLAQTIQEDSPEWARQHGCR